MWQMSLVVHLLSYEMKRKGLTCHHWPLGRGRRGTRFSETSCRFLKLVRMQPRMSHCRDLSVELWEAHWALEYIGKTLQICMKLRTERVIFCFVLNALSLNWTLYSYEKHLSTIKSPLQKCDVTSLMFLSVAS